MAKNLSIIILIMMLAYVSCAGGGRPRATMERKTQDKIWRPCQDFEHNNPVGKLCNRLCVKRKANGKCKKWKTNVKDFSNEKDFLFFRNNAMIFIDEKMVL